jgi:HSP20 family molecular chaperone IbpA
MEEGPYFDAIGTNNTRKRKNPRCERQIWLAELGERKQARFEEGVLRIFLKRFARRLMTEGTA